MRFVYGKQDFSTMERGSENCYLLTNGLGGFSSATMTGGVTRNDHALLMACRKAPNHRYNLVHRLSEQISTGQEQFFLSSQEFADGKEKETGYRHLSCFVMEDFPKWLYQNAGIEVSRQIAMKQGENTVALRYVVKNRTVTDCTLQITPYLQFVKKGQALKKNQAFTFEDGKITSNGIELYLHTNGTVTETKLSYETCFYAYDACDGRPKKGLAAANHIVTLQVPAGESGCLFLIYTTEEKTDTAEEIFAGAKSYKDSLRKAADLKDAVAQQLVTSAEQFISKRESTGGKTILAGFPFFEDWGRDTMIALPGCAIATGQPDTAKDILRTFMANERNGLMPNLFPEGGKEPLYNTADAALLFINCVYLYYEKTKDIDFVKEAYPVMKRIVEAYQKGTEFGIHMDDDGLVMAGQDLDQVTWMDVRVGEILPTPRHGKPVEINAYWYNALCIMERLSPLVKEEKAGYQRLAEQVKKSFAAQFWMEEKRCLKDVISGTRADTQLRCNQIWAVSMPFTMLPREKEKQVVETVFEKLYTPYGLRTLSPEDEEFHPTYGGPQLARDMAYHQGTVWTFPLGAYYLAYLKVNEYSQEAKETVKSQLLVMEAALREGCIGQLPEIYDGAVPARSQGCFAQAWSVGEILRVYEALERGQGTEISGAF